MKKNLLLFAAVFFSALMFAQSKVNLIVFSEAGDPFYAYVNGIRQNDKPETNVKITGISPNISLRVVFENRALPELKKNMPLEAGFEHTVRIKKDAKKQVKLTYFGQTPISDEPTAGVATVPYHSVENPAPAASSSEVSSTQATQTGNTTVTSSTTTTTRGTTTNDNVAVNMNAAGVGITMNVAGMDNAGAVQMSSTSSTTVTTTRSSSTGNISDNNTVASEPVVNSAPAATGCSGAMSPSSFASMKKSVESKPFSDTKMSTAKVATKNACLTISQVKEICKLFSMDDEKLTYAKYAYDHCVDKSNYYQVSEVFAFSGTTDEFNKFLEQ